MYDIAVVGAGPRGLPVALLAANHGLKVALLDGNPLSTWSPERMLDLQMRSPTSFHLFSGLPNYEQYGLDSFLGLPHVPYETQQALEACPRTLTRKQFYEYLRHIFSVVVQHVDFIRDDVVSVGGTTIKTTRDQLEATYTVLSRGNTSARVPPIWMNSHPNVLTPAQALQLAPHTKSIAIVGSGQLAAEYAVWLSQQNTVYWITKTVDKPRVARYPAPTWTDWGPRSALSSYYRGLTSDTQRLTYLESVRAWQPSITPEVAALIDSPSIHRVVAATTAELDEALSSDYLLLCTGPLLTTRELPLTNIVGHPQLANLPLVTDSFRLAAPNDNVYLTGLLSIGWDGPRQASVVSAGLTAQEIVGDVLNRM